VFRKVANNHATDDQSGVSIVGVDRFSFAYRIRDHVLVLGREDAVAPDGGAAQLVNIDTFLKWQPPHDAKPLTAPQLERIAADIVDAFRALGVETIIERRR
jgi:hypothetical protein